MKRYSILIVLFMLLVHSSAQVTHPLELIGGEGFQPDTLTLAPGDSIHAMIPLQHSMFQVEMAAWEAGVPGEGIGIAIGDGTLNPGIEFTFDMDSIGTFYYLCMQHPEEKGVIIVDEMYMGINDRSLPGFSVYPQPASDRMHVAHVQGSHSIQVMDDQGRQVMIHAGGAEEGIDITSLSTGLYFITLLDRVGEPIARERLVISR